MWSEKCQKGFRWLSVGCLALAAGGCFTSNRPSKPGAGECCIASVIAEARRAIET